MRNFQLVAQNIDVTPFHLALSREPDLWNADLFRQTYENTPHADVDDIILRYSSIEKTASGPAEVQNDGGAVWYPGAQKLPEAKPLVLNLMAYLGSYELSRMLVTRLKPGGRILPHSDDVGNYVHLGDIARYHIVIQGLPGSIFRCGGEEVCMKTGEIWWFEAHKEHEIINNSADDRIHLMADLRQW